MKKRRWIHITVLAGFFSVWPQASLSVWAEEPTPEPQQESSEKPAPADPIQESWIEAIQAEQGENRFANPGDEPDEATQNPFGTEEGPSFVSTAIRFLLLMGLMIGAFYFVTRVLKNRAGIVGPSGGPVQVLTSVPLMPGRFIQVVDMAGQMMVLGVSESGVRLLSVIDDTSVSEKIRLWHANRPQPSAGLSWLEGLIKGADFRFWQSGSEKNESFDDMLKGRPPSDHVPVTELQNLVNLQKKKMRRIESSRD